MMKSKKDNAIKKHEDKYIHIPKTILYILCPLVLVWYVLVLIVSTALRLIFGMVSLVIVPIALIFVAEVDLIKKYFSGKFTKIFWDTLDGKKWDEVL